MLPYRNNKGLYTYNNFYRLLNSFHNVGCNLWAMGNFRIKFQQAHLSKKTRDSKIFGKSTWKI